jgi:CRP-like cAMP-binding protein
MYAALDRLGMVRQYETEQPIYRYNDRAEHWFRIVSGAARRSALSAEGQRHIIDFLLPGDFFGFYAHGAYQSNAEAIVPGTIVARYGRSSAECLADSDPQVARCIRGIAFEWIVRLQRRAVLLGRSSALEKIGAFLLEMADRSSIQRTDWIHLPMSRSDIADYLGMAVETVSRTLTVLRARRAITFADRDARQVKICDPTALEVLVNRVEEWSVPSHTVAPNAQSQ